MDKLVVVVDLDYIYIEKIGEWIVYRIKNPNQADDIISLTQGLYFLTDNIFFNIIDENNSINCRYSFENNTVLLEFDGITAEILKTKKNELTELKKKFDTIGYNESTKCLNVSKYFFIEDDAFDNELKGIVKEISAQSTQSSENIDDSFMSLNAADAENIISKLKNIDKRNFYCYDRYFYDYNSADILNNLFYFRRALPGQLLASTLLPVLKSKIFKEIIAGDNVLLSKDRKSYYSKIAGRIRWQGELLEVTPVKSIDKQLKNYEKEINCADASLIINGGLYNCANITVDKDLYVIGNIINTGITVKGSIYVTGKIESCGANKSIYAEENIIAVSIKNSIVTAGLNILASEEIINSEVKAGADIILDGKLQLINGGKLEAGKSIVCSNIGDGKTETQIILSADTPEISERKKMTGMREEFQTALKKINYRFSELTELRDKDQATQNDIVEIRELSQKKSKYEKNIELINKKMEELSNKRSDNQVNLRLSVKETIQPKTLIKINNIPKEITEPLNEISFIFSKNTILTGKFTSSRLTETVTPPENKINKSREQIDISTIRKVMVLESADIQTAATMYEKFLTLPKEKLIIEQIAGAAKTVKVIAVEKKDTDADDSFLKQYIPIKYKAPAQQQTQITKKIKVEGNSIDDCITQFSKNYKKEKSQIKYKVLQEGKSGFLGVGAKKYIIEID